MSATTSSAYEWSTLPWRTIERQVYKLQKRIYQASRHGDLKRVHQLQRLLTHSWSAKCLAVRRISQDNQGKKTAGVDGVRNLTPSDRMGLVSQLDLTTPAQPTRRVWIPKPGTTEKRPLGIPVMRDRARQALVKLALEPEWEARFERNSYGFRPGRSCHDALQAIFKALQTKPRFVLDADIAKCFDRINHQALLDKLQTFPTLKRVIHGWLTAGVMEGSELFPTTEGTPQGGVVSPLLANIALHGLEQAITTAFPGSRRINGVLLAWQPQVVRYADDFVVLHHDLAVIERCQQIASEWLAGLGLELKPSKTRITHTLREHEGNLGFEFLGFHVRQYPTSERRSGRTTRGKPLGFKTLIKPSKEAQRRHLAALRQVMRNMKTAPQQALITRLNPIIRGWTHYYASCVAKATFSRMDHLTFAKLFSWACRRHPNKGKAWVSAKYWRLETGHWTFAEKGGPRLYQHGQTPIERHIKVRGEKSPFDGDWLYWSTRLGRHPDVEPITALLLKRQQGKCPWCGLVFRDGELWERDHVVPISCGGSPRLDNLQLLHRHCHDAKSACDGSQAKRGPHDNEPKN